MRARDLIRMALRYTFSFGQGHLSVFMSSLSVWGLVLATAVLLTVLSVMNGFEREMRDRILALVPHMTISLPRQQDDAQQVAKILNEEPGIVSVEPFVRFDGMVLRGGRVTAISGLGLNQWPALPGSVTLGAFPEQGQELVLGDSVAERLRVKEGDFLTILASSTNSYRAGSINSERFRVMKVVDTGTELDEALALMSLTSAAKLSGLLVAADRYEAGAGTEKTTEKRTEKRAGIGAGTGAGQDEILISGLQIRVSDPFNVEAYRDSVRRTLPPGAFMLSWRATHGNLYTAIQLSRDLVVLLLASIIGIAAFNVISALVLIVMDQADAIAILKTLGARSWDIAAVFVLQGAFIGIAGAGIGLMLGALISKFLPSLVSAVEKALGFQFLNTDVYPVSFIPVDLRTEDVLLIALVAVFACVLAALYPALRAARLAPAKVLQSVR
ncbi:MAG: FtsX-like permease family protein [Pseudomonadota bacterium]